MKTILLAAFVFGILAFTNALIRNDNCTRVAARQCDESEHHLHCHNDEDESIHLCIGDTIQISQCREMTCIHHDGDMVLIRGCHDVEPQAGCRIIPMDESKVYPDCCPKLDCSKKRHH